MRLLLVSCLLCLIGDVLSAQDQRLEGTITDARTGARLAGVRVEVQGAGVVARADGDGRFNLALAPGSYVLEVSLVGYRVAHQDVSVERGVVAQVTIELSEGTGPFEELVVVGATTNQSPTVQALYGREVQALRGITLDDPVRALQALPAVSATDDFYSEFAVRGNGFEHVGLAVDGVPAPYLMHSVYGVPDGGSITMINTDAVAGLSLFPGSYPQRYGRRIGAYADIALREGNREHVAGRAGLSGTSAAALAEGPLASHRGSWLISARKSYLDLLLKRIEPDANLAFGFTDLEAKLVFDINPANQLELLAIGGRSAFHEAPEQLSVNDEASIRGRAWLGGLAWRVAPSARWSVTQRLFSTGLTYRNDNVDGNALDTYHAGIVGWRSDAMFAPVSWLDLQVGADAQHMTSAATRSRAADQSPLTEVHAHHAGSPAGSAYVIAATSARGWTLSPGVRVDYWGPTRAAVTSPWVTGEGRLTSATTVHAGIGEYRQFPELERIYGIHGGGTSLRPEVSRHFDVGVSQQLFPGSKVQFTWFDRSESDVLWQATAEPRRRADGTIQPGDEDSKWSNALTGRARGAEVMIRRDWPTGLSGWVGYGFNRLRYRDISTGDVFWGDQDQRHTLSLYGQYRLSSRSSVGAKFRYGSNYPVKGYVIEDDTAKRPSLFAGGPILFQTLGSVRNSLRLPAYARLDVRVDRTFTIAGKRGTLFVEVANAMNRTNFRNVPYGVDTRGRVLGGTDTLLPILPSAGLVIEF